MHGRILTWILGSRIIRSCALAEYFTPIRVYSWRGHPRIIKRTCVYQGLSGFAPEACRTNFVHPYYFSLCSLHLPKARHIPPQRWNFYGNMTLWRFCVKFWQTQRVYFSPQLGLISVTTRAWRVKIALVLVWPVELHEESSKFFMSQWTWLWHSWSVRLSYRGKSRTKLWEEALVHWSYRRKIGRLLSW